MVGGCFSSFTTCLCKFLCIAVLSVLSLSMGAFGALGDRYYCSPGCFVAESVCCDVTCVLVRQGLELFTAF